MATLMWAADVMLTNKQVVRAEYTEDFEFKCDNDNVMKAYRIANEDQFAMVSPVLTSPPLRTLPYVYDEPTAVAGLLVETLVEQNNVETITFYGSGYVDPDDIDADATDLDAPDPDVFKMVPQLPESKFGFEQPFVAKTLVEKMYVEGKKELLDEIEEINAEIWAIKAKRKSKWADHPDHKYHDAIVAYYGPKLTKALNNAVTNVDEIINTAKRKFLAASVAAETKKAAGEAGGADIVGQATEAAGRAAEVAAVAGRTDIGLPAAAISIVGSGQGSRGKATEEEATRHGAIEGGRSVIERLSEQIAGQAVRDGAKIDPTAAQQVLRYIIGDSYVTGVHTAAEIIGPGAQITAGIDAVEATIDWASWTPGWAEAADLARFGTLSDILDESGITIKSILDTALDRLSNAIATGLENGDPTSVIAQSLYQTDADGNVTDDSIVSANAYMIANTETSSMMNQAAIDTYTQNGISQWSWVAEDDDRTCGVCEDLDGEVFKCKSSDDLGDDSGDDSSDNSDESDQTDEGEDVEKASDSSDNSDSSDSSNSDSSDGPDVDEYGYGDGIRPGCAHPNCRCKTEPYYEIEGVPLSSEDYVPEGDTNDMESLRADAGVDQSGDQTDEQSTEQESA